MAQEALLLVTVGRVAHAAQHLPSDATIAVVLRSIRVGMWLVNLTLARFIYSTLVNYCCSAPVGGGRDATGTATFTVGGTSCFCCYCTYN